MNYVEEEDHWSSCPISPNINDLIETDSQPKMKKEKLNIAMIKMRKDTDLMNFQNVKTFIKDSGYSLSFNKTKQWTLWKQSYNHCSLKYSTSGKCGGVWQCRLCAYVGRFFNRQLKWVFRTCENTNLRVTYPPPYVWYRLDAQFNIHLPSVRVITSTENSFLTDG